MILDHLLQVLSCFELWQADERAMPFMNTNFLVLTEL